MYVELLGLPASGKSTVIGRFNRLAASNGRSIANISQIDELDKSAKGVPGFVSRRAATRAIYRSEQFRKVYQDTSSLASEVFQGNLTFLSLFIATGARYMTYQAQPDRFDYFVADEGLLHRMMHGLMKYDGDKSRILGEFLDTMPLIDTVIFLEIDPKTCFERATARLSKRRGAGVPLKRVQQQVRNVHGSPEFLEARQNLMRQACDSLEAKGSKIVRINTTTSIDENSAELTRSLEQIV